MIKAIQTQYKGYNFRSRLEARWAVFFDDIGMSWEYEPEGFELENGCKYLPDFRVSYFGNPSVWLEVKGVAPTDSEIMKMRLLIKGHLDNDDSNMPGHGCILAGQPINGKHYNLFGYPKKYRHAKCLAETSETGVYVSGFYTNEISFEQLGVSLGIIRYDLDSYHRSIYAGRIFQSALRACSARFEFGESGATV